MKRVGDRLLPVVGLAAGGVVGHLLAYAATFPAGIIRYHHLMGSGHGSFHRVALAAALLAGVGTAALCIRSVRGSGRSLVPRIPMLAGAQVVGFVLMELLERHGDLVRTLADPGVRLGLVVQVLVAAALVTLLRGFLRVVRAVAALLHPRRPSRPATVLWPSHGSVPPPSGAAHPFARRRAPPVPATSS